MSALDGPLQLRLLSPQAWRATYVGLDPGTVYVFRVWARFEDGTQGESATEWATTGL